MRHLLQLLILSSSLIGQTWTEEASLIPENPTNNRFGHSVSISGDYAIVGALLDDSGGSDAGSAYIFHWNGSAWEEQTMLIASDAAAGDKFGNDVSISGDYAVVGAYLDDVGGTNSGSAYIFHRIGSDWIEEAKILASDIDAEDLFGSAVSISGDYVVIGAYLDDAGGTNSGSAYIFHRNGSEWVEQSKLIANDAAYGDAFGIDVSIAGDYVLIGANEAGNYKPAGSAYMFHRIDSTWFQTAKLTASDAAEGDDFGRIVSVSGEYALIGASGNDDIADNTGSAYIFAWNGSEWLEQTKLIASDAAEGTSFGYDVAMSGDYVFISGNDGSRTVYVFHWNGLEWVEDTKLLPRSTTQYFGNDISISGDHAIVGNWGNNYSNIYRLTPKLSEGSIIINEIMQNPNVVSDSYGEWFELHNPTDEALSLQGLTIHDNGSDTIKVVEPIIIYPSEYFILGNHKNFINNGGVEVDYEYSNFILGNSSDEILLTNMDGVVVDSVAWDGGPIFPDPSGASMFLNNPLHDNSIGSNWSASTIPFGDGDLGTPGLPNFLSNIAIQPSALDFDTVLVGESSDLSVIISNDGNAALRIDSLKYNDSIFTVLLADSLIETSKVLTISFNPTEFGFVSDTLLIYSNDPDARISKVTVTGFGYYLSPDIELEDTTINFGGVMDGLTSVQKFTIFNIGDAELEVDSIYTTEPFMVSPAKGLVATGDSLSLDVMFAPDDEAPFTGSLTIVAGNDPDENTLTVNLIGVGTAQAPIMTISKNKLDFGLIQAGQVVSRTTTLYNIGMLDLEFEGVLISGSILFTTSFSDTTIAPGDSVEVIFQFAPSEHVNQAVASATISATGLDDKIVSLQAGYFGPLFHVSKDGNDSMGHGTAQSPFASIQYGIDASFNGDTVLVQPGVYVENINYAGKNIVVTSQYIISADTSHISQTVIDGNQTGSVVAFTQGVDFTSELIGFTIRGGSGTIQETSQLGGGILVAREARGATLSYLNIIDNSGTVGGGICILGSLDGVQNTIINQCNIVDNRANTGGGIYASRTEISITNSTIINNQGTQMAGGIALNGCSSVVTGSIISNNISGDHAGGLWAVGSENYSSLSMKKVLIANNQIGSNGEGSAFMIGSSSNGFNVNIEKSTFVHNVSTSGVGRGIWLESGNTFSMQNSIFYYSNGIRTEASTEITYSDIQNGWEGVGNIDADPMFCDPNEGNYHLVDASPCVGTASDGGVIGAFGVNCLISAHEEQLIPLDYALAQNYPNPFNPSTNIKYELPELSNVHLTIYDVTGRQVAILQNQDRPAGHYEVQWNGLDDSGNQVTTGVYFARLLVGDYSKTIKMLYLK